MSKAPPGDREPAYSRLQSLYMASFDANRDQGQEDGRRWGEGDATEDELGRLAEVRRQVGILWEATYLSDDLRSDGLGPWDFFVGIIRPEAKDDHDALWAFWVDDAGEEASRLIEFPGYAMGFAMGALAAWDARHPFESERDTRDANRADLDSQIVQVVRMAVEGHESSLSWEELTETMVKAMTMNPTDEYDREHTAALVRRTIAKIRAKAR